MRQMFELGTPVYTHFYVRQVTLKSKKKVSHRRISSFELHVNTL